MEENIHLTNLYKAIETYNNSVGDDEKMVLVNEKISNKNEEDLLFLRCLEAAGVDNWEGYDIAIDYFEEDKVIYAEQNG